MLSSVVWFYSKLVFILQDDFYRVSHLVHRLMFLRLRFVNIVLFQCIQNFKTFQTGVIVPQHSFIMSELFLDTR